jgi:hypothetical protein
MFFKQPPADPLPAFRDFVTNEKQRLTQKRQALVKSEMDKRMAELKKFSLSFKVSDNIMTCTGVIFIFPIYSLTNPFPTTWFRFWPRMKRSRNKSVTRLVRMPALRKHGRSVSTLSSIPLLTPLVPLSRIRQQPNQVRMDARFPQRHQVQQRRSLRLQKHPPRRRHLQRLQKEERDLSICLSRPFRLSKERSLGLLPMQPRPMATALDLLWLLLEQRHLLRQHLPPV